MSTNCTQQEILLLTGTSFSGRQFCSKTDRDDRTPVSEKEKLQEACWNGLLQQMLPEIYECPGNDTKLYLWQIREHKSFIEIELGELPGIAEQIFSIDPYLFCNFQCLS